MNMQITQLIKLDPANEILEELINTTEPLNVRAIYSRAKSFPDITATSVQLRKLCDEGLITAVGDTNQYKVYSITEAGRAKYESRNDDLIAAVNASQPEVTAVIPSPANEVSSSGETMTYRILKYIQAHPNCTSDEVVRAFELKTSIHSYVNRYIGTGHVVVTINNRKKYYSLLDTVDSFYVGCSNNKRNVAAEKNRFRLAYTHDHCLIITGLTDQPIELNPQYTQQLVEFISDSIMPVAVFEQ